MKITMTTSDAYHHLLPISTYLFNRNWSSEREVELVGYKKPEMELPSNFKFVSLGEQVGGKTNFSGDLRKYFQSIPDKWVIWTMEDTFVKKVDFNKLANCLNCIFIPNVGRINLSDECVKQDHIETEFGMDGNAVYENTQTANYRLSTQISIWNKEFLLKYLTPGLSPWDFETQESINDGWRIVGFDKEGMAVHHNEGVLKRDIYKYNFTGLEVEVEEMKKLGIL